MKTKIISLLVLLVAMQSCSQEVKMEKIRNVYKEVKHREAEISHQAKFYIGACNFEILINDSPVYRYYGELDGSMSSSYPINADILKSGLQTWEIRVMPIHIDGIPQKAILKGARVELKIESTKFKKNGDIENSSTIIDFKAPLGIDEDTEEEILEGSGKPYISYKGVFEAKVPYELEGWSKGVEFDPSNSKELKKEVLAKFNELRGYIVNNEMHKMEDAVLHKTKELAQSFFVGKEKCKKWEKVYLKTVDGSLDDFKMEPIEHTELKFYGRNKMVTLLYTVKKDPIPYLKGQDALLGLYKKDGRKRISSFYIYLYRPKKGGPLEVIR